MEAEGANTIEDEVGLGCKMVEKSWVGSVDALTKSHTHPCDFLGIPRLIFNGNCCFSRCCEHNVKLYAPQLNSDPFVLPGLPHRIELTRSQLSIYARSETEFPGKPMRTELNSFGQVMNNFFKLEPEYAEYFRNQMGRKAWIIGPVSLCNRNVEDKAERGQKSAIDERSCLNWLDSKKSNSVLYVSFGSLVRMNPIQLLELVHGLEAFDCSFIWTVGKIQESVGDDEPWSNDHRLEFLLRLPSDSTALPSLGSARAMASVFWRWWNPNSLDFLAMVKSNEVA
ncbi:Abscisate beta-glucosyltransferase [Camellia lanceoleosa]|uniref:Abscisate beta-glucosyltransferase n=1 Tax=Camellia lanceoleosa TaxID=1840588 RepID=A0ACC0HQD9_9ERIC|nr:Abscisate beta-glucosyltransferase [Camellia lanceoleosa]